MRNEIIKLKTAVFLVAILIGAITIFTNTFLTRTTFASINGAPGGRTGAPGESSCTSCHSQNSGSGQTNIIAPANYVPGQTYQIQVQNVSSDSSRQSWGFELTALANSVMAGALTNTDANTRSRTSSGKTYMVQTTAGTYSGQTGGSTWSFSWTAPATDVGNVTMYAAGLHADDDFSEDGDRTFLTNVVIQPQPAVVIHHGFSDFDGDGKADPSIFRPSTGTWYVNRSTQGFVAAQLGTATDKLAPADFDGDDKADIAVWREGAPTEAKFYVLESSTSTLRIEAFGQTGDQIMSVGDWDGDGKADPSVFRDSGSGQSVFYYRGSLNNPSGAVTFIPWGTAGDKPMHGDFDGDGKFDAAVFRPSTQTWYIRQSSNGLLKTDYWGLATDKFVSADYDGDGKTDLAVFRNGVWYVKQSSDGAPLFVNWGLSTDTPVPADYDGDAKTDVAVYRNGVWYLRLSGTGMMSAQTFGLSSDAPIPNAFVQ